MDLEPYIYRPHPIYRLPSREDAAVACKTAEGKKEFRDAMLNELGGRGSDKDVSWVDWWWSRSRLPWRNISYWNYQCAWDSLGVRHYEGCRWPKRRRVRIGPQIGPQAKPTVDLCRLALFWTNVYRGKKRSEKVCQIEVLRLSRRRLRVQVPSLPPLSFQRFLQFLY